jgi:SPOR domain
VPKNDDGEFELILGNKQLLGVFFIVIVLLAVFFTMGYIVGRNSAPLITADTGGGHKDDSKPLVVDSAAPKQEPAPAPTPAPAVNVPPASEPAPAVETPKAVTKAEPPPKRVVEKEKPPVAKKEEPPAKKEIPGKSRGSEPLSQQPEQGKTYLQLVATGKPDADAMVDLLRKNGFKAFDYQVPEKPALYRVLVGPVPDGGVNKLRADLQGKSFPGDHAVVKKSF